VRTGITTLGACGDVTRNVTGCPVAGVDADELVDASPLVYEVTRLLNGNPDFYNLPRKYKGRDYRLPLVVWSIRRSTTWADRPRGTRSPARSGSPCASAAGCRPIRTWPEPLDAFVRWREVVPVVRGHLRDLSRQRRAPQNREKARLKFLFIRGGWTPAKFLAALERRLGFRCAPA
jgi:sulfite reductase (ferredoxin)